MSQSPKHKISSCIWCDGKDQEVVQFYNKTFENSEISFSSPMLSTLTIAGQELSFLNAGPHFTPNPTISLYTICESESEIDRLFSLLSDGGKVMMPLDKYDWSSRYAWVEDKYHVSWQLTLGKIEDLGQKITPALMFTGDQFGRAKEAIAWYMNIFDDSQLYFTHPYPADDKLQAGKIAHAQFDLSGQRFVAMDSGLFHGTSFTEGMSLVISCQDQSEVDYYWNNLSKHGAESQCGWLKDKFGVSWQVVPVQLSSLMNHPTKGQLVNKAFMTMKKIDLNRLQAIAEE